MVNVQIKSPLEIIESRKGFFVGKSIITDGEKQEIVRFSPYFSDRPRAEECLKHYSVFRSLVEF